MAVNTSGTVLDLIAIVLEGGGPPEERLSALEKADALRGAMKASWQKPGVDRVLVEKAREDFAEV